MKTLIVHPEDPTTTFLSQIYSRIRNKTVINGGITKSELRKLIDSHDRIIMLGHGSPYGLLSKNQFSDPGFHIIDGSLVSSIKNKSNSIFIWCHADMFVQRYGLEGLNCGMFIREVGEARYYGFDNIKWDMINQSNERFSWILSKYINESTGIIYQKLLHEYGLLSRTNPVARFNLKRLYLTSLGTMISPNKMFIMDK